MRCNRGYFVILSNTVRVCSLSTFSALSQRWEISNAFSETNKIAGLE